MNKVYRIVWNAATQSWVAASELARARGKSTSRRRTALALATLSALAVSPVWAQTYDFNTDLNGQLNQLTVPGNVWVMPGVTLTNSNLVLSNGTSSTPWTVLNDGTQVAPGGTYNGVLAVNGNGSQITNSSTGVIHSLSYTAVSTNGNGNSIVNDGLITSDNAGVGATVLMSGNYSDATDTQTLTNSGTISGLNLAGSTQTGAVTIFSSGSTTVNNTGTIISPDNAGYGVTVQATSGVPATSAVVINNSGTIQADNGVYVRDAATSVVNNTDHGQIVGRSVGVQLLNTSGQRNDSSIINNGTDALIQGGIHGIAANNSSNQPMLLQVNNAGTIVGGNNPLGSFDYQAGIHTSTTSADVVNTGTIEGGVGIWASGFPGIANTIYNAGTITGNSGTAIAFVYGDHNVLTLDTGSVLNGVANGDYFNQGINQSDLILQGTNADSFDKFLNFQTLTVQDGGAGTYWSMNGTGNFSQSATINSGELHLQDAATTLNTPTTTVQTAGTLSGYGTVNGDVTNNGTIAPGSGVPGSTAFGALTINGDYTSNSGTVRVNTVLNDGGALSNQQTDRLLIVGNVTGTTVLDVRPQGSGASTDLNGNNIVDSNEGISLVQVGIRRRVMVVV